RVTQASDHSGENSLMNRSIGPMVPLRLAASAPVSTTIVSAAATAASRMPRLDSMDRTYHTMMMATVRATIGMDERDPEAHTMSHDNGSMAMPVVRRQPENLSTAIAKMTGPHIAEITPNAFASPTVPVARRCTPQNPGFRK